jgi:hypothetical protein
MGAMKRFAEEVSVIVGDGGEITERVLEIGQMAMNLSYKRGLKRGEHKDDNPEFIKIVKDCQARYERGEREE